LGAPKVYWALPDQRQWPSAYLGALLKAPDHCRPVEHFRPIAYYTCVLENKDWTRQSRSSAASARNQTMFNFKSEDGAPAVEYQPPSRSSISSGSSSTSRCSASSSSSSSSSSSGEDADAFPEPQPQMPQPQAVAPAAGAAEPLLRDGVTQDWRGFKFTQTYPPGVSATGQRQALGWEVTCYWSRHADGQICRRTANFNAHGGRLELERKLKWWCMQCHAVATRADHRDLPFPAKDCLPSLAQLERLQFPPADATGFMRPQKRAR